MSSDEEKDAGINAPQKARECVNGEPASLVSVLGEETIISTIEPFTDYLETAVAAYDCSGNQIGRVLAGNEYCRFLEKVEGSKCADAGRKATLAAIKSGRKEITNCCGGLILCASPIKNNGSIIGAVVGAVSEVPSDEESLKETARCCGVDFEQLRQAAGKTFHKPDYLYDAAIKHLDTIAQLLGTIYGASREKERALAIATEKKQDLDRHIREIEALNKVITAASGSLIPEVLLTQASKAIQEATDARLVAIYTLDDKKGVLRLGGSSYEPDPAIRASVETLALDGSVEDLVMKSGKIVVVFDLATDERVTPHLREIAMNQGFTSFVAMPVTSRDEVLGMLLVFSDSRDICSENQIRFIDVLSYQLGIALQNSRFYREVESNNQFLNNLLNGMAEGVYIYGKNGAFEYINRAGTEITGYTREEILGKTILDLVVPEKVEAIKKMMMRREAGGTDRYEVDIIGKDGNRIVIRQTVSPLYENGAIVGAIGVATDITEKKEAEQRINLLAAAVDNTHESVIISDLNGDIISINNAGAALLGYEADAITGMHIGDFWSGSNPEGLKEQIYAGTLKGGWEGQMWYRRADGSSLPVFVSSARVDDASGKPMALVGIARDISAEQRLTSEILRRNRELAVLNAVAVATSSSLDIRQALKNSLDAIIDSMSYNGGIIFLMEKGSQLLSPAAGTYAIPEEMMVHLQTIKMGQGHTGKIAESGAPIFIDDYKSSEYYLPALPDLFPIASMGGVPLIFKDKVLGVLIVSTATPHEFDENEQTLLAAVGNSIGVAIENANLFEDVARGKNEWETTFDAMTNGVSIHDLDFNIIRANSALAKMLGMTIDQIVGRKCYEVFHDRDKPLTVCPQALAFKDGCSHTLVVEEKKLQAVLNISSDPIFDQDGNITGVVHDVRDITVQERLREQLAQSEKIRALGEMAGGVAHDFNNFLTVILGNTQLLLSKIDGGDGNQEFRESLESVQRAAADAAETVRRIQEFTRVRTARSFTTVDVNSVMLNAIDIARPRWRDEAEVRGAKIEIKTMLAGTSPVYANESELAEVFINLIINAADALRDGGKITVTTDTEPDGEWVLAVVADNGKGMDEEVKKRVFEPFFSTKGVSGSGLGLSVAYGIVNRHGGDIIVESKAAEGTRFIVRLPVATMAELTGASELSEVAELAAAAEKESGPVRRGKLLIVDDEPMVRKLLGDMLRGMAQYYETAEDGEQALAVFDAAVDAGEPFDLVMTDLGMPGMSGWDVVEAIKQRSPETPVVLITGWGDQLDAQKMKVSRVDSVIAKPFKAEDIRRTLSKAIS